MMKDRTRYLVCHLFLLCGLSFVLTAQAELPPETRWADPSSVQLDIEFPGDGYHANWEMFRCDCGDLLIRSELSVPGETESGESLLVAGRVVLNRGFGDSDEELLGASLDAPALMMQLVLSLLDRIEPAGPSVITADRQVDVNEPLNPIHLDSGGASGTFWAPWSVKGSLKPVTDTRRQFVLNFSFSTGNPGEEMLGSMRLWGLAEFARREFPIPPSTELSGWSINWRNETDPAIAAAADAETLEELRKLLRKSRQTSESKS